MLRGWQFEDPMHSVEKSAVNDNRGWENALNRPICIGAI